MSVIPTDDDDNHKIEKLAADTARANFKERLRVLDVLSNPANKTPFEKKNLAQQLELANELLLVQRRAIFEVTVIPFALACTFAAIEVVSEADVLEHRADLAFKIHRVLMGSPGSRLMVVDVTRKWARNTMHAVLEQFNVTCKSDWYSREADCERLKVMANFHGGVSHVMVTSAETLHAPEAGTTNLLVVLPQLIGKAKEKEDHSTHQSEAESDASS